MNAVLIEDHPMLRGMLHTIITDRCDCKIIGETSSVTGGFALVRELCPEVIVLDLCLADGDGFHVAEYARCHLKAKTRIVIFTGRIDAVTVYKAEQLGVDGFLDKVGFNVDGFTKAFARIIDGERIYCETFVQLRQARHRDTIGFDKILSPQEQLVLSMIGAAYDDNEIATQLSISVRTAETHRFHIMNKVNVHKHHALIRFARRNGFHWSVPATPELAAALLKRQHG